MAHLKSIKPHCVDETMLKYVYCISIRSKLDETHQVFVARVIQYIHDHGIRYTVRPTCQLVDGESSTIIQLFMNGIILPFNSKDINDHLATKSSRQLKPTSKSIYLHRC